MAVQEVAARAAARVVMLVAVMEVLRVRGVSKAVDPRADPAEEMGAQLEGSTGRATEARVKATEVRAKVARVAEARAVVREAVEAADRARVIRVEEAVAGRKDYPILRHKCKHHRDSSSRGGWPSSA